MNEYIDQAMKLIERGFAPIPLTGKAPIFKGWEKLRGITAEQITAWDKQRMWHNIGMICGEASGNIIVMDFDGMPAYRTFIEKFPELAETYTVKTGSGRGMHCYYRVDLLPENCDAKGIELDGESVNFEIRGDGRQVVIPPSIHPDTKQPYTVEKRIAIMHLPDMAGVYAWVKGLQKQEIWNPPTVRFQERSTDLNPMLLAAVERHFTSQEHKVHGNWINTSCPNASQHKRGDKVFSFGYSTEYACGHCFRCGVMNLKSILAFIGIDANDYGGFYEKSDPPIMLATGWPTRSHSSAPVQPQVVTPLKVVKRSSRLTAYVERVHDYDSPRENAPVIFPLKVMHKFGGMAKIGRRGKLIGIVGISGGGKTSLLETMVDGYLNYNTPVLVWSPEWSPDEFVERSVQRYGGPSMEDMYFHDLFVQELQRGVKNGFGIEMNAAKKAATSESVGILRGWESEVGYVDEPFLNARQFQSCIESTLAGLDFKPGVMVFDYVQLLHAMEENSDLTMYNMLMKIKAVCSAFQLQGVLATQVTKESTRGQAGGKLLDSLAARFVNDDAFNLFITINPDIDKTTGDFQPSSVLKVAKNSFGKKGQVRVPTNWERLSYGDVEHPNQYFGEDD